MSSSPDRPHALLSESELEDRIAWNRAQQVTPGGPPNAHTKRALRDLQGEMAALIDERNSRADMQQLPF